MNQALAVKGIRQNGQTAALVAEAKCRNRRATLAALRWRR